MDAEDENPDVALAMRVFRDACKHPEDKLVDGWAPVGAGGGLIGCHNVSMIRCSDCGQVVDAGTLAARRELAELLARISAGPDTDGEPR